MIRFIFEWEKNLNYLFIYISIMYFIFNRPFK